MVIGEATGVSPIIAMGIAFNLVNHAKVVPPDPWNNTPLKNKQQIRVNRG